MRRAARHLAPVVIDPATRDLLQSLLAIDPRRAEVVRTSTPARRRPLRQDGPSAAYGRADDEGNDGRTS